MADYLSSIKDMYQTELGRTPEAAGMNSWMNALTSGAMDLNQVGQQIYGSQEAQNYRARPPAPFSSNAPAGSLFDMPTLTPESGTTTSTATGTSGIDWNTPGVAGLLDQIRNWTGIASGNAANAPGNINNFYRNMMQNALQPQAFQGTLNNLRQRNMLDSSVASDALAGAASGIAGQVGNQALDSYLKGFDVQQGMPNMLGQLANVLGGKSTTATGTQTDPMAAYRLAFGYV